MYETNTNEVEEMNPTPSTTNDAMNSNGDKKPSSSAGTECPTKSKIHNSFSTDTCPLKNVSGTTNTNTVTHPDVPPTNENDNKPDNEKPNKNHVPTSTNEHQSFVAIVDLTQDEVVETKIAVTKISPEKIDLHAKDESHMVKVKQEPMENKKKVSSINKDLMTYELYPLTSYICMYTL